MLRIIRPPVSIAALVSLLLPPVAILCGARCVPARAAGVSAPAPAGCHSERAASGPTDQVTAAQPDCCAAPSALPPSLLTAVRSPSPEPLQAVSQITPASPLPPPRAGAWNLRSLPFP